MNDKPFVSVVIPVYNDTERLKLCLEALEAQTYPPDSYEVIVADNNSTPPLSPQELTRFPHVILTQEKLQGCPAARNKAISLAKGEIIAATDSDCIPASNWLEKGVAHMISNPDAGQIGGRIDMFFLDPENPTAIEIWDTIFGLNQRRFVEINKFAATANVFVRRSVIEDVGAMNPDFRAGNDVEWSRRIQEKGYKLIYADDAVVKHPARRTLGELSRRFLHYTAGWYQRETRDGFPGVGYVASLFLHLLPPVVTVIRLWNEPEIKEIKSIEKRIKVIGVSLFIRYLTTLERIRLMLGGRPRYS